MSKEIQKFELNGKEYRVIDLDKEATIRMEEVAYSLYWESIEGIINQVSDKAVKEKAEVGKLILALAKSEHIKKALALICWGADEKKFDPKSYEKRIEEFNDMPIRIRRELTPNVANFFTGIGQSIMDDSLIYSGNLQKLAPKSTTSS